MTCYVIVVVHKFIAGLCVALRGDRVLTHKFSDIRNMECQTLHLNMPNRAKLQKHFRPRRPSHTRDSLPKPQPCHAMLKYGASVSRRMGICFMDYVISSVLSITFIA
jgi:hypothetical protein